MATVTTSQIGSGTTSAVTDIVVKDLDMTVSNYVKDRTPITNMAMSKKVKVNSTVHLWATDVYRLPQLNATSEGAAVTAAQAANSTRATLNNYTQIFTTVVGATGTARAVEQAGGDPQAYQEVKQLTEIMFDVEAQLVRMDAYSVKYSGLGTTNSGNASSSGRRFGSLNSFAGTHSFNGTTGNVLTDLVTIRSDGNDNFSNNAGFANNYADGLNYFAAGSGGLTNQIFDPVLYKQLVTTAEQRFNAKITDIVCPVSMRTMLSNNIPQSRSINRVMSEAGDTIMTYEGDFNYTYEIQDNWVQDQLDSATQTSIYFLNPDVVQWGSLRDLGPNNEIFSNADASLDQYILEGTLIVRNQAGVGVLHNISASASGTVGNVSIANRYVQRYIFNGTGAIV